MPSIRLTPLQPTSFDLWRERVLTVPRRTLLQEVTLERDAASGTFRTLADRLVGDDDTRTLVGELGKLSVVLNTLLADQRSGFSVGIGQSSADIRAALSEDGAMARAINDCATAIAQLDVEEPAEPTDPDVPSEAGIPNADGMIVLRGLDLVREPLLATGVSATKVNRQLADWLKSAQSLAALEVLVLRGDPWAHRYSAIGDAFTRTTNGVDEDERRERLGQLVALEFDVTHALLVGGGVG
ncbi:hypothetical protein SAMN05216359_101137 [Roseateles sp. YR242]|uniref:hypothetical protein n=1 Tax=Roseateles sp. YR242 TaxID=1855305 RepID=UPI0008D10D5D|nr:hypothetical protein [Roseateles sp. YR242]SEK24014.1 hypothetical protein SAMN05216359_101137 [Roseateles sp. YR242]